ncbi:MAG: aldo/keto reductase [Anaerolineae bacterium]
MSAVQTTDMVRLGASDVYVSQIGLGTWQWGDKMVWGYGNGYNDTHLAAAFQASLQAGVNFFDTAEMYGFGRSERLLGECIRQTSKPVVVATKFMPLPYRLRAADLLKALRASLERLGLDKVDLYQIHWPMPPVAVETWADALADAVEAGLTRAVGVSNYNEDQMRRAHEMLYRRGLPLASNQIEFSLIQRKPETTGLLAACRELNITPIAYSPLGQGLLTGKYTPDHAPAGARGRKYSKRLLAQIQPLVALLRQIGDAHGKTPAQIALAWTVAKGTLPIPGAKNVTQAASNAAALGLHLTPNEVDLLDRASARIA